MARTHKPVKYYLIRLNKDYIEKDARMLHVASIIMLKHGNDDYNHFMNRSEDLVKKYWIWDEYYPSHITMAQCFEVKQIKKYIRENLQVEKQDGWCSDFLHGLLTFAFRYRPHIDVTSASWINNCHVVDILKTYPYGIKMNEQARKIGRNSCRILFGLCMHHSNQTPEYMAGVFASGILIKKDGIHYASYNKKVMNILLKWGIPIEGTYNNRYIISPIWPALFSIYMPKICQKTWLNIENPYGADLYAPILWNTYVNAHFVANGIPYLRSRRTIFYCYECEEGTVNKLYNLRLEKGLNSLDPKIKDCVQLWAGKSRNREKKKYELS